MPHSTADEGVTVPEEDTEIPDAPSADGDKAGDEKSEDGSVAGRLQANTIHKQEVKLEDLFNDDDDDDDDEEFPSSRGLPDNAGSSPTSAPM